MIHPGSSNSEPIEPFEELEGQRLDIYTLEKCRGAGAQGVVFRATDTLGVVYALKVLGLHGSGSAERALEEATRQASVLHRSVTRVFTPGIGNVQLAQEERRVLFIPSEYAPHGNCDKQPPFVASPITPDVIDSMIDLVDGLQQIHRAGIVHNDIKPANILQFREAHSGREDIVLKITDFGLASVVDALGRSKVYGLTLAFMAPEVPEQSGFAADVYSLGATFYYMLTGRYPIELTFADEQEHADFEQGRVDSLALWKQAHRESARPNAHDVKPGFPERLALLIVRMMSVRVDARPSLKECIEDLQRVREDISHREYFQMPESLKSSLASNGTVLYQPSVREFRPQVYGSMGRRMCVIQAALVPNSLTQYRRLTHQVYRHLGGSFTLAETYGAFDLQLLAWATPEAIAELEQALNVEFPQGKVVCHHALNVTHFHWPVHVQAEQPLSPVYALAAQEYSGVDGYAADDYCGPQENRVENSVGAYMYIHAGGRAISAGDRRTAAELVGRRLHSLWSSGQFSSLTLVEFYPSANGTILMIKCVSSSYSGLKLLASVVGDFEQHISTETFPETTRFAFDVVGFNCAVRTQLFESSRHHY